MLRSMAADWILSARVVNSFGDSMGIILLLSGLLARARLPRQTNAGSPWDYANAGSSSGSGELSRDGKRSKSGPISLTLRRY